MNYSRCTNFGIFLILSTALLLYSPTAMADCSETEMTAVFIVGNIYPGTEQALETLSIYLTEAPTYPTDDELLAAINTVEYCYGYQLSGTIAPFRHYYCPPGDFGATAIIDERNGQVPFAGTVIWAGTGQVVVPMESSHEWAYLAGEPAAEPTAFGVFPSVLDPYIEPEILAANVMSELRRTDVVHSFAECGDYSAVLYAYVPAVGCLFPDVAKAVVIVTGFCGPPWNGEPVQTNNQSWGAVKSLYR